MSSITIKSNLASLGTQRRLGTTTAELRHSFERLSSGLRINRASDDAAGLAISTSLNADNRVFSQGIRNLNDGLSLLNVADGALSELSSIVVRIRELAEQSANGTLSNQQRKALDQEAQELSEEYTRIAQTTEINGLKLFDGSLEVLSLQAGYGESGAVTSSLGGAIGDGTFGQASSLPVGSDPYWVSSGDFNSDGFLDLVSANRSGNNLSLLLGAGDGTFSNVGSFMAENQPFQVFLGDLDDDGALDLVSANISGTLSVLLGNGDGSFEQSTSVDVGFFPRSVTGGDINGDGKIDLVSGNWGDNTVSVLLGLGDGSFGAASTYNVGNGPSSLILRDFNQDGALDISTADSSVDTVSVLFGDGDGTFLQATSYSVGNDPHTIVSEDFNGDSFLDIATANFDDDTISVLLGSGDGTFGQSTSFAVGAGPLSLISADFNGDNIFDIASTDRNDNTVSILIGDGEGSFNQATSFAVGNTPRGLVSGDFNGDGVLDIASAEYGTDTVSIILGNTTSGVGPILPFSLATKADARQAMAPLDRKIEQLALQKGTIGAFQSRIDTTINNLQITNTNVKAAESRIADIDTATESARLARLNILQQAGASVLAQANIQPQIALRLLGN